mgnify:CR=1 FL=1
MTVQRTEVEMARAQLLKAARSAVRLKHSLVADDELNEVLPVLEASFDLSVAHGVLPDKAASELFKGVLVDES